MLTAEANERLTRVGPGTPMGELMRRYWIPVRPTAQLLEEEVMAVRILGEDLVLFRSADGQMGLVGDRCPHRMTEMRYGIPDVGGLRCCYHGWMFNPAGQCIETPLEAAHDPFKDRIRIKGYPVQEMGGLVWAYMGPEPTPLLPPWDLFVMPNSLRQIGIMNLECNWLQCHENTGDPTHSVYLHGNLFEYVLRKQGKLEERAADGQMHTLYARMQTGIGIESLYVNPTRYGMEKGIIYSKALGADRDRKSRHSTVIFPVLHPDGRAGNGAAGVPDPGAGGRHQHLPHQLRLLYCARRKYRPRCRRPFPTTTCRCSTTMADRSWTLCWRRTPTPGSPRDRSPTVRRSTWDAPTCPSCSCGGSSRSRCESWRTAATR